MHFIRKNSSAVVDLTAAFCMAAIVNAIALLCRAVFDIIALLCMAVRQKTGLTGMGDGAEVKVHICSENNFPTAAGLASSAAGYACLGEETSDKTP